MREVCREQKGEAYYEGGGRSEQKGKAEDEGSNRS